MVKHGGSRKKSAVGALIFAVGFLLVLFCLPPYPSTVHAGRERYEAVWEDGTVTRESYASAYSALLGAEDGALVLVRDGLRGEIRTSGQFAQNRALFSEGSLLDLLTQSFGGLSPLERAALYKEFGETGYYSGDFYAFDGSRVFRTGRSSFRELVLLDGNISSKAVRGTGAEKLVVRAGAQFTASALIGTNIGEIEAEAPYAVRDGAVYLLAPGGRRLVAALPRIKELAVKDCDFCDEGALAPCKELVSLELPFAGNAPSFAGKEFDGRLAWAFGGEIPESLKRVKITGGTIAEFAFTGCGGVEEIDLCGIPAEDISLSAFSGCTGLMTLHTSKADLPFDHFVRRELPCGCFLYERSNLR